MPLRLRLYSPIFYLTLTLLSWSCSQPKGNQRLGESCQSPSDCSSSLCADIDGIRQCTQSCSDDALCPDGYACFSGYCIIDQTPLDQNQMSNPIDPAPQSECLSIFDCMSECQEDQDCVSDCFLNGTAVGQQTLIQLEDCVAIMCLTLDDTCFDQYCVSEYTGCLTDQITPTADCFSNYVCQLDCEEQPCFDACLSESTESTLNDLEALNLCLDEEAGECADASCVISACRTEYQTCYRP